MQVSRRQGLQGSFGGQLGSGLAVELARRVPWASSRCSCVCERGLHSCACLIVGPQRHLARERRELVLSSRRPMAAVLHVPDSMSRLFRRGSCVAAPWVRSTTAQACQPPLPSSSTRLRAFQHSTPSPATPRSPVLSSKLYFQVPSSILPGHIIHRSARPARRRRRCRRCAEFPAIPHKGCAQHGEPPPFLLPLRGAYARACSDHLSPCLDERPTRSA